MTTTLSLQDLKVGQKFQSTSYTLTAAEIIDYATKYDPQPFHMDEKAARRSVFGGLVASGWHSASVSMRLIVESIHLNCGLIGLGGEIAWLKPTRPDDSLSVASEIKEIIPSRSKPGQAVVIVHCAVANQHGETVIEFTPRLMVFGGAV